MNNLILKEIYRAVLFSKLSHKLPSEINECYRDDDFKEIHKIIINNEMNFIENTNCKCYMFMYANTIFISLSSSLTYSNKKLVHIKDNICVNRELFCQYQSLEEELLKQINELNKNKNIKKIYVCGYNMGGALATVISAIIAEHFHNMFLVSCFTFGAPEVGNKYFKKYFNQNVVCNYRIIVDNDRNVYWNNYQHVTRPLILGNDIIEEGKEQKCPSIFSKLFKWSDISSSNHVDNAADIDIYSKRLKTIMITYTNNLTKVESSNNPNRIKREELESIASSLSNKSVSTQKPKSPQSDDNISHKSFACNESILLKRIENIENMVMRYFEKIQVNNVPDSNTSIKDIVVQF